MELTLAQGNIVDFSGSGWIAVVQTLYGGASVARSNSGLRSGSIAPVFGLVDGNPIYTTRAASLFGG